jgi:hypothetical protein
MAEADLYDVERLPRMMSLRAMAAYFSWQRQRPGFPEESMSVGGSPDSLPMNFDSVND